MCHCTNLLVPPLRDNFYGIISWLSDFGASIHTTNRRAIPFNIADIAHVLISLSDSTQTTSCHDDSIYLSFHYYYRMYSTFRF